MVVLSVVLLFGILKVQNVTFCIFHQSRISFVCPCLHNRNLALSE
jgi:hypothetical protein